MEAATPFNSASCRLAAVSLRRMTGVSNRAAVSESSARISVISRLMTANVHRKRHFPIHVALTCIGKHRFVYMWFSSLPSQFNGFRRKRLDATSLDGSLLSRTGSSSGRSESDRALLVQHAMYERDGDRA